MTTSLSIIHFKSSTRFSLKWDWYPHNLISMIVLKVFSSFHENWYSKWYSWSFMYRYLLDYKTGEKANHDDNINEDSWILVPYLFLVMLIEKSTLHKLRAYQSYLIVKFVWNFITYDKCHKTVDSHFYFSLSMLRGMINIEVNLWYCSASVVLY